MKFRSNRNKLSNREKSFLLATLDIAKTSTCSIKHGAMIVASGSQILAKGTNVMRNDAHLFEDFERPQRPYGVSEHAEEAAVRKAGNSNLKGATIYVARVDKHAMPAMSKPCLSCDKLLRQVGIRKVVYTSDWADSREI